MNARFQINGSKVVIGSKYLHGLAVHKGLPTGEISIREKEPPFVAHSGLHGDKTRGISQNGHAFRAGFRDRRLRRLFGNRLLDKQLIFWIKGALADELEDLFSRLDSYASDKISPWQNAPV